MKRNSPKNPYPHAPIKQPYSYAVPSNHVCDSDSYIQTLHAPMTLANDELTSYNRPLYNDNPWRWQEPSSLVFHTWPRTICEAREMSLHIWAMICVYYVYYDCCVVLFYAFFFLVQRYYGNRCFSECFLPKAY